MYPFLFFCLPFGDDIKPQNFCNLPQVSTMLPTIPQQLNNSFILSSCLYFHRTTIPKVSTMVILFKHIQYNADLMGNLANTSYFRIVKLGARARLVAVPRFVLETLISFGRRSPPWNLGQCQHRHPETISLVLHKPQGRKRFELKNVAILTR